MTGMFKPEVPEAMASAPPPINMKPKRLKTALDGQTRKARREGRSKLKIKLNKTSTATGIQVPR